MSIAICSGIHSSRKSQSNCTKNVFRGEHQQQNVKTFKFNTKPRLSNIFATPPMISSFRMLPKSRHLMLFANFS